MTENKSAISSVSSGVGVQNDEAITLSQTLVDNDSAHLLGRLDRANIRWDIERLRLTMGRQAVSFGKGRLFMPLDLVAPFRPTTLDTSYKPGVDVARADLFQGLSGQFTLLAAYLNDWSREGTALVFNGKVSVGDWELEVFSGGIHGDVVLGGSAFFNGGDIGYYGDLNLTQGVDEDFVRAVVGALYMPTPKTTLIAELYGQSLGTRDTEEYGDLYALPRYQRGEIWLANQIYGAVSGYYEWTPLVQAGGTVIINYIDTSALFMPSLIWSIDERLSLSAGMLFGLGKGGQDFATLSQRTEFGLAPTSAFLHASFYF